MVVARVGVAAAAVVVAAADRDVVVAGDRLDARARAAAARPRRTRRRSRRGRRGSSGARIRAPRASSSQRLQRVGVGVDPAEDRDPHHRWKYCARRRRSEISEQGRSSCRASPSLGPARSGWRPRSPPRARRRLHRLRVGRDGRRPCAPLGPRPHVHAVVDERLAADARARSPRGARPAPALPTGARARRRAARAGRRAARARRAHPAQHARPGRRARGAAQARGDRRPAPRRAPVPAARRRRRWRRARSTTPTS